MVEVLNQCKAILSDPFRYEFREKVYNLLLTTNKHRNDLPKEILKELIESFSSYQKDSSELNSYKVTDNIIALYNNLLERGI